MTRYRGRHRKPSHTGRNLAAISASGAFALPMVAMSAGEARADILDEIAKCESGGNPNAQNPNSTASGAFQIIDGTLRGLGGSGSASDYSFTEQRAFAEKLFAQRGSQPWNASQSCWGGKDNAAPQQQARNATQAAPTRKAKTAPQGKAARLTGGRAADGTGAFICGPATYPLAVCDPGDGGQVMQYPAYSGRGSSGVAKVAATRVSWPNAPADLHRRDSRGLGSYTCQPSHYGYAACGPEDQGQTVDYPRFDGH